MILAVALALALAADPAPKPPPDPARAELDQVAARIERLKARKLGGEDVTLELERLLVRAQDLVQQIERARSSGAAPVPTAEGPTPEELRERADALRDEGDRLAVELRDLDARIEAVRRERRAEAGLESLAQERALFGDPGARGIAPGATGSGGEPVEEGGALFGPRTGAEGDDRSQGTALQRLDRLRAERARIVARQAALAAEADALDDEAQRLGEMR
jgi:hypothetical protein